MKNYKTDIQKKNIISFSLLIHLILLIIICTIIGIKCTHKTIIPKSNPYINYSGGWYTKDNKLVNVNHFYDKTGYSTKEYKSLHRKINNDIKPGTFLCYKVTNTDIKIYIDDKLVVDTPYTPNIFSNKSSGTVWSFYKFKKSDIGKTITMKIKPYYNNGFCEITDMCISEPYTYIAQTVKDNIYFLIIGILLILIGIILIVINILVITIQKLHSYTLLYVGYSCIIIAVWLLGVTKILSLIIPNPQLIQAISSNCIYILPLPSLLLLDDIFDFKPKKLFRISYYSISLIYILAWLLHLTNFVDLYSSTMLSYISAALSLIFIIILIITTGISSNKNEKDSIETVNNKKFFTRPLIFLAIICIILDIIMMLLKTRMPYMFIGCYLLVLMISLASKAISKIISMSRELEHANFVAQLAYKDALTNLGNRTAYMEKLDELKKNLDSHDALAYIAFDVNNLKMVNDTLGHLHGDNLIVDAANILRKSFTNNSHIYRIGGDEFAVIIDDANAEALYKIGITQFNSNINNHNNFYNKPYDVSMAYGCEFYNKSKPSNLDRIIILADNNMYANKKEFKRLNTN